MKTEVLSVTAPNALEDALNILRAGGLIAFPTDTVYGLGTLVSNADSMADIYRVKRRAPEKALPILLADAAQLKGIAASVSPAAQRLAARFWPGALTLILPKRANVSDNVSALGTIGVRVPDHAFARKLLRAAGPMAVSSANISGRKSPVSAEDVLKQLNGSIPLILDGGRTPGGVSSTVADCAGDEVVILRAGPISSEAIRAAL